MKKVLLMVLLVLCVALTGCNKYKTYTELSLDEFNKKLDNKDTFVMVIGKASCSACAAYKETMEEIIKDKQIEIFYLDLDKLDDDAYAKVHSKYVIESTPTTLFIRDGSEISAYVRLVGAAGYSKVIENLKNYGYIGD